MSEPQNTQLIFIFSNDMSFIIYNIIFNLIQMSL